VPSVVSTVGAANANSYVDETFMDAYCDARLDAGAWVDESDDDKKAAALIQATRVLDSTYDWNGWLATDTQSLRWPRDGALNYDQAFGPNSMYDFDSTLTAYFSNNIVPLQVKNATCEMALYILQQAGYDASVNDLKAIRVGPIRVDFNTDVGNASVPSTVIEILRHMGSFQGKTAGNTISTPTLMRT
jgi:hypothetical protein